MPTTKPTPAPRKVKLPRWFRFAIHFPSRVNAEVLDLALGMLYLTLYPWPREVVSEAGLAWLARLYGVGAAWWVVKFWWRTGWYGRQLDRIARLGRAVAHLVLAAVRGWLHLLGWLASLPGKIRRKDA